ncbi:MAG: hypothetical protein WDO15_12610 [Bacteroidota bacterium]
MAIVLFSACSEKQSVSTKTYYDIDSLVTLQIKSLQGLQLHKSVEIDGKKEQTTFTPDSLQWAHELDIFRQLDQINKSSFRDAYVVTDTKDVNSNLTVRELRANRPVPVSSVRFYYLGTPKDLKRIEASLMEENSLYVNERTMTIELGKSYRIEGIQKMVMSDSVKFVVEGNVVE